jgi:WD40 repeat protein
MSKFFKKLFGIKEEILIPQIKENPHPPLLICGDTNGGINFWESVPEGFKLFKVCGNSGKPITCITTYNDYLIYGCSDGTILSSYFYDCQGSVMSNHNTMINSLVVFNDYLISSSYGNKKIEITNLKTRTLCAPIICNSVVNCLVVYDDKFICGNHNGSISIYTEDILALEFTLKLSLTVKAHNHCKRLIIHNNQLVSSDHDGNIKIWSLSSFELKYSLIVPGKCITSLVSYGDQLISIVNYTKVLIWKLDKCIYAFNYKNKIASLNVLIFDDQLIMGDRMFDLRTKKSRAMLRKDGAISSMCVLVNHHIKHE